MISQLFIDSISDQNTKEVLRRLIDMLKSNPWINGQWDLIEVTANGAVTGASRVHRLGFKPKDAQVISTSGAGTVTFKFDQFTKDSIYYDTSGAVSFRAIVGTARED